MEGSRGEGWVAPTPVHPTHEPVPESGQASTTRTGGYFPLTLARETNVAHMVDPGYQKMVPYHPDYHTASKGS